MPATINVGHVALEFWHIAVAGLALILSVLASAHAILYKRDTRAAIAWVGFVWLVPLVGAVLYFIFGVNRLRRRAALLRGEFAAVSRASAEPKCLPEELHRHLPAHTGHLTCWRGWWARWWGGRCFRAIEIEPLVNGDEAFPAMLEAIRQARQTISFQTYIFDRDEAGWRSRMHLGEAVAAGRGGAGVD